MKFLEGRGVSEEEFFQALGRLEKPSTAEEIAWSINLTRIITKPGEVKPATKRQVYSTAYKSSLDPRLNTGREFRDKPNGKGTKPVVIYSLASMRESSRR